MPVNEYINHHDLVTKHRAYLSLAILSMSFCLLCSCFIPDTGLMLHLTDPGTGRNWLTGALCFWNDPVLRAIISSFSRSGRGSFSSYSSSSSYSRSLWDVDRITVVFGCGWGVSVGSLDCCCSTLWKKLIETLSWRKLLRMHTTPSLLVASAHC